jgi:hypothetical protein
VVAPNTPNTTLVLNSPTRGDFVFADTDVPAKIPFGGEQHLVVHELVGGARQVDAMGRSDRPLEWSGIFVGANALSRARALDAMRVEGLPLVLTWSELAYSVLIRSFKPDFEQRFQIPYSIICEVVKDLTSSSSAGQASIDDAILGDMATATTLGAKVGDSTLDGLLGTLSTAVKSVSSFAQASQSTINSVLAPIAAVTTQVNTLIASAGNTIANVTTLGGILPSNPIAQQAAKLTGQVTAMTQSPILYQLNSVVGRMGLNVAGVSSSGQQVTTAGGNLYRMATDAYGDPSAWTGIARANSLTDPQLAGINTIEIPSLPDGADGVFSA